MSFCFRTSHEKAGMETTPAILSSKQSGPSIAKYLKPNLDQLMINYNHRVNLSFSYDTRIFSFNHKT